ncbi:UvrD-like helicase family protein [Cellulophaga sp. RHA19]|uniref:UvrD-helicase domain-containing protein n=1 Tax=Cellulophaga sp. RHA19 TaxID=1798237 RepID=UPI000C2C99B4|nr:UvrD-helicase domain-containing protein [Cellulophaga sp. RHA19]PKB44196.1 UvrD-like helicase family protein [Cellulophaga sp. RHA19]
MKTIPTRTNLSSLNNQQRKAVLSAEKRILVLAGAGSGKTKTLLNKIDYLINDEQADSDSILAITFTKNAANEMVDRMILSADKTGFYKKVMETKGVTQKDLAIERKNMLEKYPWLNRITIKTFHSLCYQIMREDGVNVFDNQFKLVPKYIDDSSEYKGLSATETEQEIIQKVAIKLSENRNYLIALKRYIIDYYVDYIREDEGGAEFRPKGKLFTTLKGEKVRSKSEQFIADWFFRNNIDYKYERKERISKTAFHPDFFIPSANVYLEHVSNLSHPTFWKEEELKKGGITCIKTYDKATQNSAVFNKVLDTVIKGRLTEGLDSATVLHYHEEFSGFKKELKKFYRSVFDVKGAIENANKTIETVGLEAKKSEYERVRLFYKVALPIIRDYDVYCTNRSYLGFDGLVEYSLKLFKEHPETRGRYQKKYKYILVDEFQDVNNKQVEFLKYLINDNSQLFCVGDDWQSIYGFRGSVVDYIVNFKDHFDNSELIKLNLNYRSTDRIVKASNEIIKKNKFQIAKDISAVKKGGAKIEVNYAEVDGETENFIYGKIQQHIAEGISPDKILILYRRTAMKANVEEKLKKSGVYVQFKTIHGAKGLEAEVVFVLGLNSARGGFPDPWMQDKIYHVIKKTEYNTLLEEERRLFYVALTRAKTQLYLMSQKGNVSEFIKDIPNELMLINEDEASVPEFELTVCKKCNSKIEDHFKFCAECGSAITVKEPIIYKEDKLFDVIKRKVKALPLKYPDGKDEIVTKARLKNTRAYEPWSIAEDKLLCDCIDEFSNSDLCVLFGRSLGGIKSRLIELNLEKQKNYKTFR